MQKSEDPHAHCIVSEFFIYSLMRLDQELSQIMTAMTRMQDNMEHSIMSQMGHRSNSSSSSLLKVVSSIEECVSFDKGIPFVVACSDLLAWEALPVLKKALASGMVEVVAAEASAVLGRTAAAS